MATNIFETSVNPISGEAFKGISFDEAGFKMDWTVQPAGYVPFEHIHLNQDEIFHVTSGELKVNVDGKEHIVGKGESITVPKGVKHIAYNNKNETLECLVEYRPGLDHDKFMQCLIGLTKDNFIDKKGGISIPKMGYCLVKMKAKSMARPTAIPSLAFNMALRFFYVRGMLSGWNKLYNKYVSE
jgi:quercetin dioxygenase-like cupin family protein